ncbi:hypothetical protein H9Q73_012591 [Fusarium xylarioides]|nr:hypothetical protein H9Q73_012591 [Fusarium xylarioides]
MLQMTTDSLNAEASLLDVSIDSLLAVEIRSLFLEEVHVDVPILKTLSGDNAKDIRADAANKYLSAKIHEIKSETGDASKSDSAANGLATGTCSDGSSSPVRSGHATPPSTVGETEHQEESKQEKELERVEKLSLWFLSQFSKDDTSYNCVYVYKVTGNIQIPRLKRAVSTVANHHDSLRTCFFPRPGSGEPVQGLLASARDFFKQVKDEDGHTLEHETKAWRNHAWQLSDGDVLRVILVNHGPEQHSLIIAYHHIAMDGVSMHLFLRDLNAVYLGHKLDSSLKQYMDISVEERKAIESGQMDDRVSYWSNLHSPPSDTLPLFPFARVKSRPIPKTYHNVESLIDIGNDLSEQIKRASQSLRITPFYFYLAALQTLFNRLLSIEDICIGVTDANRSKSSLQTIGFFLNLLPLRFNVQKDTKFSDLVTNTAQHYRAAQVNMGVPFDVILDKANVPRESTSTPLFQVAMNYRQGNFSEIPLGGSSLDFKDGFDAQSPYDLAFSITPNNKTTYVQVVAREDLYTGEGTDTLLSAYLALLRDASRDVSKSLETINLYDQTAPSASRGDPLALGKLMADEGVTFTLGTPTEYLMLIRHGGQALKTMGSWRNATSGGEAITAQLKASFRTLQQPPVLTDCYGPTEISCCATMKTIDLDNDGDDSVYSSVGPANPNTCIYILDESGHFIPQGLTGEICVGGVGVALSYLDEKSTSQKFVPNPFATDEHTEKGWTTMYRTGDKGLIRADGGLQFMGRMDGDTTVKLRGLRIDLDDVANVMMQQFKDSLQDVVVTIRDDPAFLVAHVVLTPGTSMDASRLQELASTLPLPQYMRPALAIELEKLPLNSSGKVDRRAIAALPLPTTPASCEPLKKVSDRKPTLVEGGLRLIWHNVLSHTGLVNTARLEPDTDFFHVGGNSLLLVRLRSAIEISMGITLPLSDMYRCSTLSGMADLVVQQKSSDYVPETIDWAAETALPQSIDLSYTHNATPVKTETGLEILMTGSTSFLGKQILHSLLNRPLVARIHCIAVDPDSEASHIKDDRVTVYSGSLSEPMLGLRRETYQHLQATVDIIILAGSQGHCLNNYSTLRSPNVESTRQMGLFALGRRIPLHYISSNRVTLLNSSADAALPAVSVRDHQPPADGTEGFTAAKWAGEVFLEKVSEAATASEGTALPVSIHRHCAIVGDEAPIEDALNALLRYSKLINAVPGVSSLNVGGYFDFLPVTDVANSFAEFAISSQGTHSGVAFKHYSSGVKVPPTDFASYMQKTYGDEFRELDLDDWIEQARKEGIEELIVLYLQAILEKGQRITFPFLGNTV